jgi:ABC-2 type transport system permease protein
VNEPAPAFDAGPSTAGGSGPWGSARRYASIYAALWRNSVLRELQFKTNFILWVVVELLWFGLQLCFMSVIYAHTETIGTWSKWQVVLLLGASHLIQQLFTAFFLSNCTQLSEYIRTGKLDFMLLLPVNTRFLVSLRQVDLGGFVNAATAVAVMLYAARQLDVAWSATRVLAFLALVALGVLVHYCLMLALASASFWTVRAQGMVWGYYNLFHIARLPDAAFRGAFRAFFTFALPILLVSNVPVRLLARTLDSPAPICWLLGLSLVCCAGSEAVWRASLRHYTSASS